MRLNSRHFDRHSIAANHWRVIACLFLFLFVSSAALGSEKCGSLDRAANAILLAQALYPELKGSELNLQFSEGTGGPLSGPTDARSLLIAVDKPQWHPPGETTERLDGAPRSQSGSIEIEFPLYFEFSFAVSIVGKTGDVVGTQLSCRPAKFINHKASKQILDAAGVINAHPEWTDAQDLEAARKLGMRFGPEKKADLLRMLPLKELSSIYGPLQITEASFRVAGMKERESSFADLHWFITAKLVGSQKTLQIMVEPFHGKIVAISE
jgi:hypothetical protein